MKNAIDLREIFNNIKKDASYKDAKMVTGDPNYGISQDVAAMKFPGPLSSAVNKPYIGTYTGVERQEDVSEYMPKEVFKPFLRDIIRYMNEDDAKAIIKKLMDELGKENPGIKLSENIETSILSFGVEKVS